MRWVFVCLFVFKSSLVQGLVLENLIQNDSLKDTFSYKKIGYYVGSFGPLHLGHQDVAQLPIQKALWILFSSCRLGAGTITRKEFLLPIVWICCFQLLNIILM
ncbi:Nucleotidyl transferase family protein [Candidatus Bealeia paramacronuclearis]|uniref:Nucleotidyl transferase family protein n=1 Tax=Candidatus Bealeia paramacronuclearis TaxID=1921001 RepID=A0ABZ2C2I1_9PROT